MGEPVKKPILGVGRFAGLNREYSVEYSIGSAAAKMRSAGGSAGYRLTRLEYGARGQHSSSTSGRVVATGLKLQYFQAARVGHLSLR